MFEMSQTLIVVYKNEMLLNQFKKLVETKDDKEEIVGIKDGSVKIVAWSQKIWLDQKKAGNITSKVLFIDDIKGVDKLIPVLDIKFDEYGAKFGWAGNQAVLFADNSAVNDDEKYNEFLTKLNELPIPEKVKGDKKAHFEVKKVAFLDKMAKGIEGVFDKKGQIHEQLLIYSIFKFYYSGLKDFMEM